ncbi:MAG: hypothetical protein H0U71_08415 [Gammaproteobacteria bacterium]|nr:hypothetical protein [Gammaproteobacteria bacterium]
MNNFKRYDPWPAFAYEDFKPSAHLIHMLMQIIGKLKLITPFEPEWSNVGLWVTSQGITTGLLPYKHAGFSVDVNLIAHQVYCTTTWGETSSFNLSSMSVAELTTKVFICLKNLSIDLEISPKPQEVPHPILFHDDTESQAYDPAVINAWWRILVSTQRVMQQYHATFTGKTPSIALMWGTLDLREVRFNGKDVAPTGMNTGYIRRNAMDEQQVETGFWAGNEMYPHAAYYSFTYPQPQNIASVTIEPNQARWDDSLAEFILHYEDVYKSSDPDNTLLSFFESTYNEGAELAHWNPKLSGLGHPI